MKLIWTAVVCVFSAGLALLLVDHTTPRLEVRPLNGIVVADSNDEFASATFELTTNVDVTVLSIDSSCSCISRSGDLPMILKAGEQAQVVVRLETSETRFPRTLYFRFNTNPPINSPVVQIEIVENSEEG